MPKLYDELAPWWPLMSAPEDYEEEAAFYGRALEEACQGPARTLVELGSGGGNNASHLKSRFKMVLVEPSAGMLKVSRALNPECEHVQGDMRTVRLNRQFDLVFVHDAVCYMTTESDLRQAIETAFMHCRPGGAALFAPDHLLENFSPSSDYGGHDNATHGLRYLEWTWDPDPSDTTYLVDYAYCCGAPTEPCEWSMTVTSKVSSRAQSGCACCRTPASNRTSSPSTIQSSNLARKVFVATKRT